MRYVEEFLLARKLDGLAIGTLYQYRLELKNLPIFLNKPTIEATTNDLRGYFSQFKDKSISTMGRKISTLKAFYGWLINEDEYNMEKNPMKKIKTPKEALLLPKALNRDDFDKLRFLPKNTRNQAILELLVASGMRIGEMINLDRNDLDMHFRRIKVLGKGNKERMVHFSVIAKFCLIAYFATRKDNNPALFINRYGNRLSIRAIEQQIKASGIKAGLRTKVTPHVMRHYVEYQVMGSVTRKCYS